MGKLLTFFIILLLIIIVGGGVFLATWDIPAPTQEVERILDDDQFPQ